MTGPGPAAGGTPILEVEGLRTVFSTPRGPVPAVDGVSLSLRPGEILGLVGESGCGKSTVLLSLLRLIRPPGRIAGGRVRYRGRELLSLPEAQMRELRGRALAMIFQDPLSTLNPAFAVGEQIRESLRLHRIVPGRGGPFDRTRTRAEVERVYRLFAEVGIPNPRTRYRSYPHQFSGGMQQRAIIAVALACEPDILLADEPTTALDVTIQAQVMDLMTRINRERGTAIVLVTHDLGLAAQFCQRIAVMYAGKIVEEGTAEEVTRDPRHPYTQGLLACLPRLGRRTRLEPIPGNVPDLLELPPGCGFAPRCAFTVEACWRTPVPLEAVGPGRRARCLLYPAVAQAAGVPPDAAPVAEREEIHA